jgi:hypothetical protein
VAGIDPSRARTKPTWRSTGLPALTGQPRRTAILLLAEAQQELGRWADSLRLLDEAQRRSRNRRSAAGGVADWECQVRTLTGSRLRRQRVLLGIAESEIDLKFGQGAFQFHSSDQLFKVRHRHSPAGTTC